MNTALLPLAWTPTCAMQRVIIHWSEGRNLANDTDREHYHLLIEQDAKGIVKVTRGDHSISDNASTGDGDYAAHTLGCNTGSIGVALCGMMGCEETPFSAGPAPITEAQWKLLEQVVAELCLRYNIPVRPETVLCHGEVQRNLGRVQRGKWDPMKWPWDLSVPSASIGSKFRTAVAVHLNQQTIKLSEVQSLAAPPISRTVILPDGTSVTGPAVRVEDGDTWLALRWVAEHYGWVVESVLTTSAVVNVVPLVERHSATDQGNAHTLEMDIEGSTGYVLVRQVAELLGASVSWDKATKTVTLKGKED